MTVPTHQFLKDVCAVGPQYYLSYDASDNQKHTTLTTLEQFGVREQSRNVYFCPASFVQGGARNDSGAQARRAFVLDVDVRPGEANHFHTIPEAIASVDAMVAANHVPAYAYMVNSGSGLHVYWLAPYDLNHPQWLQINNGFIYRWDTCGEPRLISDRKTSRRYSGLFRLPETMNTKHGTFLPCLIHAGSGVRLSQDWIDFWVAEANKLSPAQVNRSGATIALAPHLQAAVEPWMLGAPMSQRMICKEDPVVVNPKPMVQQCKVLQELINKPTEHNEPAYLEVARALSTARDGRQLFHKIAAFDPARYSPNWADEKFDHAQSGFDKPVNCRNLRDAISGGSTALCQGCPMFRPNGKPRALQSAFELRSEDLAPQQQPVPTHTQVVVGDEYPFKVDKVVHQIPPYLDPTNAHNHYFVNTASDNQLCKQGKRDASGAVAPPVELSEFPFWYSKTWGLDTTEHWKDNAVVCTYLSCEGKYETFLTDPTATNNFSVFCEAASRSGLKLNPKLQSHVLDYMMFSYGRLQRTPGSRSIAYEKQGWKKIDGATAFMSGDEMFHGSQTITTTRADNFSRTLVDNWEMGRKGSYQKHLDAIMTYNHPDVDPAVKLTLLLGLGSPLASLLGNSGSTYVMLHGKGGVGKSETMKAVLSFYGKPQATILSSSDTERGMRGAIAAANNLPMYFDEITTWGDSQKDEFRDLLLETNSSGKRFMANRDSTAKQDVDETSCTFVLVSSNKKLIEFVPGLNDGDVAAKTRCLEISFVDSKYDGSWTFKFSDMQEALQENYGWMGAVFLDYVIDNYDRVRKEVRAYYQAEYAKAGNDGKKRFDCRAIAVARMTEQIMQELGWMANTSWTDDALTQDRLRKAIVDTDAEMNAPVDASAVVELNPSQKMESAIGAIVASYKGCIVTVIDGIVPDSHRMMQKVGGVLVVDTKSQAQPVEQLTLFPWILDEWARKYHKTEGRTFVDAWRAGGHTITYVSNYNANEVTKMPGLGTSQTAWIFPPRWTKTTGP